MLFISRQLRQSCIGPALLQLFQRPRDLHIHALQHLAPAPGLGGADPFEISCDATFNVRAKLKFCSESQAAIIDEDEVRVVGVEICICYLPLWRSRLLV